MFRNVRCSGFYLRPAGSGLLDMDEHDYFSSIWTRSLFSAAMLFFINSATFITLLNRPKHRNDSLIRDKKSNKHIANYYKKLVRAFKREAVQFLVAKNLAVNHSPLEALPAVQTWTLQTWPQGRGHVTFCGLRFPMKNVMLFKKRLKVWNQEIWVELECKVREVSLFLSSLPTTYMQSQLLG